jgi:hypothetical protein
MSNAAFELADLLSGWNAVPHGATPEAVRGATTVPPNEEFWRTQVHAVELLSEVDRVIQSLRLQNKRYQHYEDVYPIWAAAVFGYSTPWQTSNSARKGLDSSVIHVLSSLGNYIDDMPTLPTLDTKARGTLMGSINEIIDLLQGDSVTLDPAVRRYVFELIASIQHTLGEAGALGSADLLARINELFGYLTILADDLKNDDATRDFGERLQDFAWKIVPYARFVVGVGLGVLGAGADMKALAE